MPQGVRLLGIVLVLAVSPLRRVLRVLRPRHLALIGDQQVLGIIDLLIHWRSPCLGAAIECLFDFVIDHLREHLIIGAKLPRHRRQLLDLLRRL